MTPELLLTRSRRARNDDTIRVVVAVIAFLIAHVGLLATPTPALSGGSLLVPAQACVYVELEHPTYFFAAVCPPPIQ